LASTVRQCSVTTSGASNPRNRGALDLEGVKRLREVLNELKGHATVFIVSSAPALLQLADMRIRVDRRRTAS
jgi:ATP-binding cassette, subfamily C, bacterial LapB